ncbi:hypothetical protein LCGC14_2699660, partial [marine sediment metagenome]
MVDVHHGQSTGHHLFGHARVVGERDHEADCCPIAEIGQQLRRDDAGVVKTAAVDEAKADVQSAEDDLEKATAENKLESAEKKLATAQGIQGKDPLKHCSIFLFLSLYVVGFFATAGAAGADFGMNNRNASDVQLGGLVGIVGATFFA